MTKQRNKEAGEILQEALDKSKAETEAEAKKREREERVKHVREKSRKEMTQRRLQAQEQNEASSKIQALVRGVKGRKQVQKLKEEAEQNEASSKIQALVRGVKGRKQVQKLKEDKATEEETQLKKLNDIQELEKIIGNFKGGKIPEKMIIERREQLTQEFKGQTGRSELQAILKNLNIPFNSKDNITKLRHKYAQYELENHIKNKELASEFKTTRRGRGRPKKQEEAPPQQEEEDRKMTPEELEEYERELDEIQEAVLTPKKSPRKIVVNREMKGNNRQINIKRREPTSEKKKT